MTIMGTCLGCQKPCFLHEEYIVRASVWAAANMTKYGGYLHARCLEKRLRRKLTRRDYLVVPKKGKWHLLDVPAYRREWADQLARC